MYQKFNSISFYFSLLCLFVFSYLLYVCIKHNLIITSFSSMLLSLFIIVLSVIGLLGFKDKNTLFPRVKSWITIIFTFLLILIFSAIHLASFIGGKDHIKTVYSPDESYTVHFYSWNAGAAGTFGIVGEINGLWFDKRFYKERRTEKAEVEWIDSHTISINKHKVDIDKGGTYFN